MKRISLIILLSSLLAGIVFSTASAQAADQLQLGLSRDFGYAGFGNDIQGLFSAKIKDPPANIIKVEFFIDSTSIGDDSTPPFSLQFNTDSYPLGLHTINAVGYTADGSQIGSNKIEVQFVPASAGTKMIGRIIIPILGIIVIIAVISIAVPLVLNKGKMSALPLGSQRKYGIGGGAVCPKCGRPFPLRLWWINIGFSKIDRCPFCGKWSFVHPRSLEELRAAEANELAQSQPESPITGETEAERLKKELDDSRYQNQ